MFFHADLQMMMDDDPLDNVELLLPEILSSLQPAWNKWEQFQSFNGVNVRPPEQKGSVEWETNQKKCFERVLRELNDSEGYTSKTCICNALKDIGMSTFANTLWSTLTG